MTQTIGQRLKTEREEQRLTLEKVFEATRIRVLYVQALEADDLSVLPSPVQARGYLRNYAEFLGLDFEQMLEEMHAMNVQQASGKVIGPADENASTPQKNHELPNVAQPLPTMESLVVLEEKSVPIEEPVSLLPDELAIQNNTSSSITIPIKPKPARRKKADSSPKPASADSPTKRRSRKKAEPESPSVVELKPETVEEPAAPVEIIPQPESVEESVPVESVPEPIIEEGIEKQQEETTSTDVSDNLWQTWMNRFGSVLSARMKRRTLIPTETSIIETESIASPAEPEIEEEIQSLPQENSLEILKNIGKDLRERRELLSLHFDEVERNTHVKAHYLEALERGALDDLPSTVQTRGMLSNYATFLDMDVDALLLRFADALQARHRERNPQKPARKPGQPIIANMPPVRTFIAGDMIFGVSMAILLVGFAIWGVSRVMNIQSQRDIKPTAPSISEVLLASPNPSLSTVTPTFLPVESFPGEATVTVEIPTQNANAEVQLNLVAVERTYMRVVVDGEIAFEGRVVPGNAYPFEAESQIEVLVGSGAAIRTVYNGRDLGLMGTFGQVVNNIYLGTEIITPTALATATGTITLTPTNTASPTATSKFTSTPVPSSTAVP
ncbi:MAG TPA: RodZ domain-containing protein [Anaerolineales bacterium]